MTDYEDYNSEKAAELNKNIEFKQIRTNLTSAIDLGFCTVSQTTSRLFYLDNPNNQPCEFHFESQTFDINPAQGHIPSKGRISFTVSYTPKEATAIIGNLILNLPYQQPIITKVSAIGKYPYISLSTQKLNFEELLIGKQAVKEVTIKNQSQVTAHFTIIKIVDDEYKDNSFSLDVQAFICI